MTGVRKVRRLSKLFTIEYYTIRNTESSVLVAVGQLLGGQVEGKNDKMLCGESEK